MDHPIAPANKFHAADLPQREYDADKAKWFLKQAGMETLKVDLSATDLFGGGVDSALLFKDKAAKASIDVNEVKEPKDGYWKSIRLKKPFVLSS